MKTLFKILFVVMSITMFLAFISTFSYMLSNPEIPYLEFLLKLSLQLFALLLISVVGFALAKVLFWTYESLIEKYFPKKQS